MPNVLVFCFWTAGDDNNHNLMWRMFVGPYWYLEKMIAAIILVSLLAFVAWQIGIVLAPVFASLVDAIIQNIMESKYRKKRLAAEQIEKAHLAEIRAMEREKELAFMLLPKAEQNRILEERVRIEDEKRAHAEAARTARLAEQNRAEEARRKAEADARAAAEALKNSPEEKRRRAIGDIIGGGY